MTDSTAPKEIEHIPVLLDEVLTGLNVQPGGRYIDGTLGGGGHTQALLRRSRPAGQVLGLDADPTAIRRIQERLPQEISTGRLTPVQTTFDRIQQVASEHGFAAVDGILLDLGLSSLQLNTPARGFAFQHDGPLDMRFNPSSRPSAAKLINTKSADEIADILYRYGDERRSRIIARAIVANGPITTTRELANIVEKAVGGRGRQKIHPATRTFQALRIAVNDELGQLERALPQMLSLLRPAGRLAIIAFHSLEDRLVKTWMRDRSRIYLPDSSLLAGGRDQAPTLSLHNKKPIVPTATELKTNPRSRSARLRIAEKWCHDAEEVALCPLPSNSFCG